MYLYTIVTLILAYVGSYLGCLIKKKQPNSHLVMIVGSIGGALIYQSTYNHSIVVTVLEQKGTLVVMAILLGCVFRIYKAVSNTLTATLYYCLTVILLSLANYLKVASRQEVIYWTDLTNGLVKEVVWDMILSRYTVIFFISVLMVLGITWLSVKFNKEEQLLKNRGKSLMISLVTIIFIFKMPTEAIGIAGSVVYPNNVEENLKVNGPGLVFLTSREGTIMEKPAHYSKQRILKLVEELKRKYPKEEKSSQVKQPTIIFMLSEALTDPTNFEGTEWKEDPMPTIRTLQKQGGMMYAPVFGGGTANTEYSVITSFSNDVLNAGALPYSYVYENPTRNHSIVNYLSSAGYESTSIHPFAKKSYNREDVFKYFGFDQSYFSEEMEKSTTVPITHTEGYISDESLVDYILYQLKQTEQPQFIHTISMQNHYDYTKEQKGELAMADNLLKNKESIAGGEKLAYYARGLKKTDNAIQKLTSELSKQKEEIYLVVYGDHLPALGDKLYDNLSVTSHENPEIAKYLTPYVVWNNHGKELETADIINPEFIVPLLLDQTEMELPPFYQFVADLARDVPAFKEKEPIYFLKNQVASTLPLDEKKLMEQYFLLVYDMLSGGQFSKELFK